MTRFEMVKLNKIILERLEGYPEKQEAHTFTFADCVLEEENKIIKI